MAARNAYEVEIRGQVVTLVELKSGQLIKAMAAGGDGEGAAGQLAISFEGLRLSIVKIGDKAVKYGDLIGDLLDEHFGPQDLLLLVKAFQALHFPGDKEMSEVVGKLTARAS